MNRREFIMRYTLSGLFGGLLFVPNIVFARDRRVADFLQNYYPVYDENQEWNFGQGRLLTGLQGQSGNYQFFVDNQWVSHSVDNARFDWRHQCLRVECNGQVVLDYDPRDRLAPQSLRLRR